MLWPKDLWVNLWVHLKPHRGQWTHQQSDLKVMLYLVALSVNTWKAPQQGKLLEELLLDTLIAPSRNHLTYWRKNIGVSSAPLGPQNMLAAVTAWLMPRTIWTSAPGVGVSSLLHPWVVKLPTQLDLHLPVISAAQVSPFLKSKQCRCWWSHSDVNVWIYPRGPTLGQRCIMLNHRAWVHTFTRCRHNRLLSRWHFSFLMNPLMLPNDTLVNVVSHH